jgi:hypothetical protein
MRHDTRDAAHGAGTTTEDAAGRRRFHPGQSFVGRFGRHALFVATDGDLRLRIRQHRMAWLMDPGATQIELVLSEGQAHCLESAATVVIEAAGATPVAVYVAEAQGFAGRAPRDAAVRRAITGALAYAKRCLDLRWQPLGARRARLQAGRD